MAKKYICNRCGKEFDIEDLTNNCHIRTDIGYGSGYDGANLELDLCIDCMCELISGCIISPLHYYD